MYLTQTLHRMVQQDPQRTATIFNERRRSVAECADRVARLAGGLRSLSVAAGDRVGIVSLNSDRYHEYLIATPWAGAVVLPINTRWSTAEMIYALHESETKVILVDDTFAAIVPALRAELPGLSTVIFCGEGDTPDGMIDFERLIGDSEPVEDPVDRGGRQ